MKILYFTADWCGPCRQMKPAVDTFVSENQDRVTLEKINVDSDTKLTVEHEIKTIPTFIFYNDANNEVARLSGVQPMSKFSNILNQCYES